MASRKFGITLENGVEYIVSVREIADDSSTDSGDTNTNTGSDTSTTEDETSSESSTESV